MQASHNFFALVRVFALAVLLFATCQSPAQEANKPWSADPDLAERWNRHINREGKIIEYYARVAKRYGPLNFIESKVPEYTLPDPLVSNDGVPVTTEEEWFTARRMELLQEFRKYMYGRRPDTLYSVRFVKEAEITDAFNGAATGRNMKAVVSIGDRVFSFPFVVFVPNSVKKPVPAVVHMKFWHVSIEENTKEPDAEYSIWPVQKLINRGYATASFFYEDVDPDDKDGYAKGIRAFLADGQSATKESWGSLSAWGWGTSRVLDYLESLDSIDATRVAVTGHSRLGTAALWAACEDTRFAVAYSNCSGSTGAALTRRKFGLHAKLSFGEFPHWYSGHAQQDNELPIDQHELISLIAPRGVYVSSADRDLGADPRGEYTSLAEAAPVFRLLRKKCISNREMPPLDDPRVEGVTGYHIRTGKHNLTDGDWTWFLDFADTLLK